MPSVERRIFDRITKFLPYSSLPDITEPGWDREPRVMHRVGDKGQHLMFVEVRHDTLASDSNSHYVAVKRAFPIFLRLTNGKPRFAAVEGAKRTPGSTVDESYQLGGEGSMTTFYAQEHGIEQLCFEPEKEGIDRLLSQGHTKENIRMYIFLRFLPSWYRRHRKHGAQIEDLSFEEFVSARLEAKSDMKFDLLELEINYKNMTIAYEEMYKRPFDPENLAVVQHALEETVGYMLPPRSEVHKVAIAANKIRDEELAKGIDDLWQKGVSVFVAFGYPHGLTVEPFIEELGKPHSEAEIAEN